MQEALGSVSGMVDSMVRLGDGHEMVKLERASNHSTGLEDDTESVISRLSSSKGPSVTGYFASDCTILDRIQELIDNLKALLEVEMLVSFKMLLLA